MIMNAVPELGPVAVNALLAASGGDPAVALTLGAGKESPLPPAAKGALRSWRRRIDPGREEERLARIGGAFLVATDPEYPPLLKQIADPPPGLYRRGQIPVAAPMIAIVGTRRCTGYGEAVAHRFAYELARAGCCVVSGLALGIDSAAHRGALAAGGSTVAALGTGIDLVYPWRNRELTAQIAASGALVSEFPLGRAPDKVGFVRRNRVISGMCAVLVVVESAGDGGAMISAKYAADQGRTVCAVPGRIDQPTSAGCHQLIRDGATLVTDPAEIYAELALGGRPMRPRLAAPDPSEPRPLRPPDEDAVLQALAAGDLLAADTLSSRASVPAARLAPALTALELAGLVSKRPDGRYERRCAFASVRADTRAS